MSQRENLPESDQQLGAPDPETPDTTLRRGTLGLLGIIFFVVAASAPLAGMTGAFPVAVGIGNGAGAAGMYVAVGIVLLLFSVGYATMSHYVTNTGAFFAYVGRGPGHRARRRVGGGVGARVPRGAVGRHRLHRLPDEAPVRGQVRPRARVVDLRTRDHRHRLRAVGALGGHRRQVPRRPAHDRAPRPASWSVRGHHRRRSGRPGLRRLLQPERSPGRRTDGRRRRRLRLRPRLLHRLRGDRHLRRGVEGPEEDGAAGHVHLGRPHHRDLRLRRLRHGDGPRRHRHPEQGVRGHGCRRRSPGRPLRHALRPDDAVRRLLADGAVRLDRPDVAVRCDAGLPEQRCSLPVLDGTCRRAAEAARSHQQAAGAVHGDHRRDRRSQCSW